MSHPVLNQIIQALHKHNPRSSAHRPVMVVFDLDSTLFDVSPRLERILVDFANVPENAKEFPESVAILRNIKMLRQDWGIKNALIRAGLDHHHPKFHHKLKTYWEEHFFSNHYLQYDQPYEGAVDFVRKLHSLGAYIVYLTGRDIPRMQIGSEATLLHWNFPINIEGTELVLKPQQGMDDAQFKKDWIEAIPENQFAKIYLFENEPVNINLVRAKLQHIELVFFDSTHSGQELPHEDIPKIIHYILTEED